MKSAFVAIIAATLFTAASATAADEWTHGWYWGFTDGKVMARVQLDLSPREKLLEWATKRATEQISPDRDTFIQAYLGGFRQGFFAERTGKIEK